MSPGVLIGLITVVGAAIQQAIAVIDPLLTILTAALCKRTPAVQPQDMKRMLAGIVSLALGLYAACLTHGGVFAVLGLQLAGGGLDVFVTALAIGFGTETANSASKILAYLKDKANPSPSASVGPIAAAQHT